MQMIDSRLELLRAVMRREHVDAWIVNGTDPHVSEYVASRWRTRAWISGFNGSAGTVVVTLDKALLWVDARYFIQAEQELKGSSFELQKLDTAQVDDHVTWLSKNMPSGSRIGMDASTLTLMGKRTLQNSFIGRRLEVVSTADWFDEIWADRPSIPNEPVSSMDVAIAGESRQEKLDRIRNACTQKDCTHTIISSLDDIAWILNLRGQDVMYNPVFLSYLLIGQKEAWLFVQESRFEPSVLEALKKDVSVLPYEAVFTQLKNVLNIEDKIYLSPDKTNMGIINALPSGMVVKEGRDFSTDFKAAKSEHELEGMRRAHLLDGVAMVKLLHGLSTTTKEHDELSIAEELHSIRGENPEYLGPSFNPIAGYRGHGALAHYAATKDSSSPITGDGLLVLDTGGQYLTGMTDITRTLIFGEPSQEMQRDYTLVLKGNLSLAAQRFPEGTCGYHLDVLARQHLWQYGLSYGHGTGHGVGFRLSVHEGPHNVSPRPVAVPLVPGMVLSDEPGVYKEGRYGIRIENLLAVRNEGTTDFGRFLSFEVLTLCPFEKRLISKDLLQPQDIRMIDSYHAWVYDELSPHLSEAEKEWLRSATSPLDE